MTSLETRKHTISCRETIKAALSKINELPTGCALILFAIDDGGKIVGSLTDGDIRRGLVNGVSLDDSVSEVMRKNFKYVGDIKDYEKINEYKKLDLKIVPWVKKDFTLIEFIDLRKLNSVIPVDAVIMAGGRGVRLKPYTNDTPKPMLELAGKPIIAHNIDRLVSFGVKNIHISVNHLKEQIISYVNSKYAHLNINFIEETDFLGTIGSIKMVDKWLNDDVLVMNADILTNIDFYDFFANYKSFKDDMSIATFNVRINIPYGVLDTEDKRIKSLIEKPSFTYYSNAGIYLVGVKMLEYIPERVKFDSTELMEKLIDAGKKVSHFPIRGYWLDIGNVQNYAKAQDDIRFIKF